VINGIDPEDADYDVAVTCAAGRGMSALSTNGGYLWNWFLYYSNLPKKIGPVNIFARVNRSFATFSKEMGRFLQPLVQRRPREDDHGDTTSQQRICDSFANSLFRVGTGRGVRPEIETR
jgi:hypothetical protein